MPTILTHPAVPLALALGLGQRTISKRLLVAGIAGSILPDLDVIAFSLGVPYGSPLGHRGFSHSLFFAAAVAALGAGFHRALHTRFITALWFLFLAVASHGALDACTDGGSGIAFLWPFSDARHFAPFQAIEVSPIGISRFLSERGAVVLQSELLWVWLPAAGIAATLMILRRTCAGARHPS